MADMGLVVVGAGGRMGRMLVKTISETEGCTLAGAIEQPGSIALGEDAGLLAGAGRANLAITDDPDAAFAHADGVLDFTAPAASVGFAEIAAKTGIVHVVGTTGLEESHFAKLRAAAARARIVQSGNMSLGVNLLAALVRKVAATLRTRLASRFTPSDMLPDCTMRAWRAAASIFAKSSSARPVVPIT